MFGTPLGHPPISTSESTNKFCWTASLQFRMCNQLGRSCLIARLPEPRISSEWCHPSRSHDKALWECLCRVLGVPPDSCEGSARAASQLPLAFDGLRLRSAERTRTPAYWASWADSLSMIQQRHPSVAATVVEQMAGESVSVHLRAASAAGGKLNLVPGFEVPGWLELARGARPAIRNVEEFGTHGAAIVEREFRDVDLFSRMAEHERALVRWLRCRRTLTPALSPVSGVALEEVTASIAPVFACSLMWPSP